MAQFNGSDEFDVVGSAAGICNIVAIDDDRKNMKRNGLILAVGLQIGIVVWLITHLYINLYTQEQSVFPLEDKNAEVLILNQSDVVTQSFRVSHDDLNEIRLMLPKEGQVFETMVIRIEGGEEPLIVEVTSEQIVNSPQVVIELPDNFNLGEMVDIKIGIFTEAEGDWKMWSQKNKYLNNPKLMGKMKINDTVRNDNLVFRPIYGDKDSIVVGDVIDMKYEISRMIENLLEGRPVWVQWSMILSFLLAIVLNGWFIYYGYILATRSLSNDQEKQMLLIIGITLIVFVLIW